MQHMINCTIFEFCKISSSSEQLFWSYSIYVSPINSRLYGSLRTLQHGVEISAPNRHPDMHPHIYPPFFLLSFPIFFDSTT